MSKTTLKSFITKFFYTISKAAKNSNWEYSEEEATETSEAIIEICNLWNLWGKLNFKFVLTLIYLSIIMSPIIKKMSAAKNSLKVEEIEKNDSK